MPSKVGNEAVNIFLLHEAALSLSSECKRLRLSVTFFQDSRALVIPSQGRERCLTFPSSSLFNLELTSILFCLAVENTALGSILPVAPEIDDFHPPPP
jgi:hypothetical protein